MTKESRNKLRLHRKRRVRAKVRGTAKKPRLCVFKSSRSVYAQVIDDEKGKTIVAADSRKVKDVKDGVDAAKKTGELVAKEARKKKIKNMVFDRGGYKYHGKVKALAEGAREGGLEF